jgi:hypothetical protein
MVQRKDIDAVLIATPDKCHAQAIHIASAAGKDSLRESRWPQIWKMLRQRCAKFLEWECACRSASCDATIWPTLPR